jgi:hypothetical protein
MKKVLKVLYQRQWEIQMGTTPTSAGLYVPFNPKPGAAIWYIDHDFRIKDFEMTDEYNCIPGEYINTPIADTIISGDRDNILKAIKYVVVTGKISELAFRVSINGQIRDRAAMFLPSVIKRNMVEAHMI